MCRPRGIAPNTYHQIRVSFVGKQSNELPTDGGSICDVLLSLGDSWLRCFPTEPNARGTVEEWGWGLEWGWGWGGVAGRGRSVGEALTLVTRNWPERGDFGHRVRVLR